MIISIFCHIAYESILSVSMIYLDKTTDITELKEQLMQILVDPRTGVILHIEVVEDLAHVTNIAGLPSLSEQIFIFHRWVA